MLPDRSAEMAGRIGPREESGKVNEGTVTLHGREATSLIKLLGDIPHRDIQAWPSGYSGSISAAKLYENLARRFLHGFKVTQEGSDTKGYCIVGPELDGLEIHASLYYPSPDKSTGFDHGDVLDDERRLFSPRSKSEEQRLADHRGIIGWKAFEPARGQMYATMRAYYEGNDRRRTVRPFFRWETTDDGRRTIMLDPFRDGIREAISSAWHPSIGPILDGMMGIVFLAAYSPDQTHWGKSSFHGRVESGSQPMEATQMGAFAVHKVAKRQQDPNSVPDDEDIQQSPILEKYEKYLEAA